jgi:protein-tyrosine-phosphatase
MTCTVLFVCTGNVCRSPMAVGLFNAHAHRVGEEQFYVARSAGTWALVGQPASAHAVTQMATRGVDISQHRGRMINRSILADAAVVIVMNQNHREALASEFPECRDKLHLMSELNDCQFDISDPYGGSLDDYAECLQTLDNLIETGYEKIKAWISNND